MEKADRGLHPDAQAIIESVQPYNRGHDIEADPLWVLKELSNRDKHRYLHLTHALMLESTVDVTARHNAVVLEQSGLQYGPFDDSTVVLRLKVLTTGPDPKVDVEFHPLFDIAFDEEGPAPGQPIRPLLADMFKYIVRTINWRLKPFF